MGRWGHECEQRSVVVTWKEESQDGFITCVMREFCAVTSMSDELQRKKVDFGEIRFYLSKSLHADGRSRA
jgi:hypothetical protein